MTDLDMDLWWNCRRGTERGCSGGGRGGELRRAGKGA